MTFARSIDSLLFPAPCNKRALFTIPWSAALVLGLLLIPTAPRLQAAPATAELWGVVHDADHAPIADATVEFTSGKLRFALTTDADGKFHFYNLPGGEYQSVFTHQRASTAGRLKITLSPLGRYRVMAELPQVSTGVWTIQEDLSPKQVPETSIRNYSRQEIHWLPSTLNLWSLIGQTEISATPERFDISGMHSDETMLFGSRGDSWSQNRVMLNGYNLTSGDGARTLLAPDLSTVESVTYNAAPTGISLPGAELELQPRSGGRTQHGEAQIFFQDGALQNVNVTARLRSFGITESDERFRHFVQGNAQLGGPLSSGWTYFVALSRQQAEKWIRNLPLPVTNALTTGTANLTGDISPRDRISLAWEGQDWGQPQGGASPQVPREASRDTTRTFEGLQGSWTRIFSPRSVLDIRAAFSSGKFDAALQPGTNQPSRVELFPSSVDIPFVPSAQAGQPIVALLNNVFTGAAPLAETFRDKRFEGMLSFQTFRDGPMRSTHQISLGTEVEWLETQEQAHAFENINLRFFRELPDSVQVFSGGNSQSTGTFFRGYAADIINMGAMTIDLAAEGTWERGSDGGTAALQKNRVTWTSAGGQVGVGYRIGHRYPTLLRAAGAQRNHQSLIHALEVVDPGGLGTSTYLWNDVNHDSTFQPGELGTLVKVEGAPFSRVDSGVKQPYTREVHLEVEQELPLGLAVSLHAYRRVEHHLLGFMNTGVLSSDYTAVTVFDPGDDGASQTGDEALRTAYNQSPATLGKDAYLLTNPSEARGFAEGYEGRLRQRARRLEWEFAFTRYRAVAQTAPGNGPLQNDWSVFAVLNDPNQAINAYGSTYFDRGLEARFWGVCQLPWDAHFSLISTFLDGAPYGRILPVTGLNQGLFGILATRRGPGDGSPNDGKRTAHNLTTDLRLSRDFGLRRGRLTASLDAFNLFNAADALQESDVTSPTHLWRIPLRFQTPRSLQLGLRFNW